MFVQNQGPFFYPRALSLVEIAVLRQIEYYMSYENYPIDFYLHSLCDYNGWIALSEILMFRRMQLIGITDNRLVALLLRECSPVVFVDVLYRKIRPSWLPYYPTAKPTQHYCVPNYPLPVMFVHPGLPLHGQALLAPHCAPKHSVHHPTIPFYRELPQPTNRGTIPLQFLYKPMESFRRQCLPKDFREPSMCRSETADANIASLTVGENRKCIESKGCVLNPEHGHPPRLNTQKLYGDRRCQNRQIDSDISSMKEGAFAPIQKAESLDEGKNISVVASSSSCPQTSIDCSETSSTCSWTDSVSEMVVRSKNDDTAKRKEEIDMDIDTETSSSISDAKNLILDGENLKIMTPIITAPLLANKMSWRNNLLGITENHTACAREEKRGIQDQTSWQNLNLGIGVESSRKTGKIDKKHEKNRFEEEGWVKVSYKKPRRNCRQREILKNTIV